MAASTASPPWQGMGRVRSVPERPATYCRVPFGKNYLRLSRLLRVSFPDDTPNLISGKSLQYLIATHTTRIVV